MPSRFKRYLIEAAAERAREQELAPDLDKLRCEGLKIVFVECPTEVALSAFFLLGMILVLFVFCLLVPFCIPIPNALLGASQFAKGMAERCRDEIRRLERLKGRLDNFDLRWKNEKAKVLNG